MTKLSGEKQPKCANCGKTITKPSRAGRQRKYCNDSCRTQAWMKRRKPNQPKADKRQNLIPARPGIARNPEGRTPKKPITAGLKGDMHDVVPDEFLIDELEGLRGRSLTFAEVLRERLKFDAISGKRNPGLMSLLEIVNRVDGRVPAPAQPKPQDDGFDFSSLTEEELHDRLLTSLRDVMRLCSMEEVRAAFNERVSDEEERQRRESQYRQPGMVRAEAVGA